MPTPQESTLTTADITVPAPVRRLAGHAEPELVWTNERGGWTFRAGDRFIKWNPHGSGLDLQAESERLRWAARWHPVPHVLEEGRDAQAQWLVTAALPGESAVAPTWLARPLDAARAIGHGLRVLHDTLPVAECPFDWSIGRRIRHRLSEDRLGAPPHDRLVVCHGDACSPNTLIGPDGRWAGHVDLGSLGVADRWADLAVASWSLDYNCGPGWQDAFFEAYGIAPDEERIRFYRHLWDHEDTLGLPGH